MTNKDALLLKPGNTVMTPNGEGVITQVSSDGNMVEVRFDGNLAVFSSGGVSPPVADVVKTLQQIHDRLLREG